MKIRCILLLTVLSFAGLQIAEAGDAAKDKQALQGTWGAIKIVEKGRIQEGAELKGLKLKIQGDKYIYEFSGKSFTATYKIDPTKKPKQMDVTFDEGPLKGKTMLAIYDIEGQEMQICGGDQRPTVFASDAKSENILFTFKREKP